MPRKERNSLGLALAQGPNGSPQSLPGSPAHDTYVVEGWNLRVSSRPPHLLWYFQFVWGITVTETQGSPQSPPHFAWRRTGKRSVEVDLGSHGSVKQGEPPACRCPKLREDMVLKSPVSFALYYLFPCAAGALGGTYIPGQAMVKTSLWWQSSAIKRHLAMCDLVKGI